MGFPRAIRIVRCEMPPGRAYDVPGDSDCQQLAPHMCVNYSARLSAALSRRCVGRVPEGGAYFRLARHGHCEVLVCSYGEHQLPTFAPDAATAPFLPSPSAVPNIVPVDPAAIREGDEGAFHALFDAWYEPLRGYARALVRDGPAADDLVQEAFVRLWDRRLSIAADTPLHAYLYRIVRNQALNLRRDLATRRRRLDDPGARDSAAVPATLPQPDADLDASAMRDELLQYLADLPPRQREAVELSRFQGLTHDEVAAAMGCAPRTVNNHLVAALSTLRRRLTEAGSALAAIIWVLS